MLLGDVRRRETGRAGGRGGPPGGAGFAGADGARLYESLLSRLQLARKLEGHDGCVNACSFVEAGDALLTGSDDRTVGVWQWATGRCVTKYASGHRGNVFQAKSLSPELSGGSHIVTCAADGQVRVGALRPDGSCCPTRLLATHRGRAHVLAVERGPGPHVVYSVGEDGQLLRMDLREEGATRLLTVRSGAAASAAGPKVPLNSISIGRLAPHRLAVVGGDPLCRVYDVRMLPTAPPEETAPAGADDAAAAPAPPRPAGPGSPAGHYSPAPMAVYAPQHLLASGLAPASSEGAAGLLGGAHVTGVSWTHADELVATYNDDDIFLFDAACGRSSSSNGSSGGGGEGPDCAPGGDSSDRHAGSLSGDHDAADAVGPSGRDDAWETGYGPATSAGGLPRADRVIGRYRGHRNCETVKGVFPVGPNHQFIASGSDCGHLFVWEKATGRLVQLLRADDSIVNVVCPHPSGACVAASGIDSDIKIFEPLAEAPAPLGPHAREVLAANRRASGGGPDSRRPRQLLLTPELFMQLVRVRQRQRAEAEAGGGGADAGDEPQADCVIM